MKENYEKPNVQVFELQLESGILTSSSGVDDDLYIEDMGNWNTWTNE